MIELVGGKVVAAKFRLERELARGGMGSVWIAYHLALECWVAIKFMDPQFASNGAARTRFEREAKAAAQLRTPHVVQVYDHGVDDDTPYIVMELLDGEDLGDRLKRQGRLTLPAMSLILDQLTKGLQRAHDIGVIHRDLKPGNVFLAKGDDGDLVKVLDFGIAKTVGGEVTDESTKTGQILGSPQYMSPEQAKGSRSVDHRSDLWSLGVILFRAVTGQRPFNGETFGDLLIAICTAPAPAASSVAPHFPPAVDRFFERALARDPDQRFQGARQMAAAFAAIADGATDTGWPRPAQPFTLEPATGDILPPGAPGPRTVIISAEPSGGTLTNASSVSPAQTSWAQRRPAALWAVIAGGVLLAVAAGAAVVLLGAPKSPPSSAAGSAVVLAPSPAPSPLPSGEQAAEPPMALPVATASGAPSAERAASLPARRGPAPAIASAKVPAPKPTANCNPPFTFDANGAKHAKPECL